MPRGGKREGAGRKQGAVTKRSRAIADKAMDQGITPLEVMLANMRHFHEQGMRDQAQACARDAAGYMHPRLTAVSAPDGGPIKFDRIEWVIVGAAANSDRPDISRAS